MRFHLTLLLLFALSSATFAQAWEVDFENFDLEVDTYLDGSDGSGGFKSSPLAFPNEFNTAYFFWQGGWAISSMTDSITSGFLNLFSAKTAGGFDGSQNYGVGQQFSYIDSRATSGPVIFNSIAITNSTYSYNSMRDGDFFAKAFGGTTGNDPDFFKLTIHAFLDGYLSEDSVEIYLADYRFEDNTQDYILNTWEELDLSVLGPADGLYFTLSSSDVGGYGINTPLFFCVDNISLSTITDLADQSILDTPIQVYPNPASDFLVIEVEEKPEGQIYLSDLTGRLLMQAPLNTEKVELDISHLSPGAYLLQWVNGAQTYSQKLLIH